MAGSKKSDEDQGLNLTSNQDAKTSLELVTSDSNHWLYLHHSDHPNYALATQLLNDGNYHQWRRAVEVSLIAKNKIAFVTGDYERPRDGSVLDMQWKRCNSMVIAWLLHSVEKDIAETLLYCDTAAEIWSDLRERFGQPSLARTYQVQKELFTITQGNITISSYYTKFKRLWDEYLVLSEIPKCGKCGSLNNLPQMILNQQILQFLVGLNESYVAVRTNVLMMKPTPTIGEIYQMLLQEEKQRGLINKSTSNTSDSTALSVFPKSKQSSSNSSQAGGQNFNPKGNQQQTGNTGNQSGSGSGNNSSNVQRKVNYYCDHCKIPGHSLSRCYKINGYPKDREKKFAGNSAVTDENKEYSEGGHMFTKSQYEKLIALLNQQQNSSSSADGNKSCMLAGPFYENSSGAW